MFGETSDHYHKADSYDKAADTLRQGNLAENLVSYITENQEKLSSRSFHSHSRFYILFLKQKKIRPHLLRIAIKLLGSPIAQEQAFITYEIYDELADLYANQGKFKERLLLLSKIKNLDSALNAITNLNPLNIKSLGGFIQRVQHHYFAGRIIRPRLGEIHVLD